MAERVYAVTELVGSSKTSIEDAIQGAITTAAASLRNLEWFEVRQVRGYIEDGVVAYYQAMLKVGFRYEK